MSVNPNPGADRLRDPQVTMDEALDILRQSPLWLDIFVMENPAYDLLCLENPFWEHRLSVSTRWRMAGYLDSYRDPRCAQIVAKAVLSQTFLYSYMATQRCVKYFMISVLGFDEAGRWAYSINMDQTKTILHMIADGKTPQEVKDFIGHQVK